MLSFGAFFIAVSTKTSIAFANLALGSLLAAFGGAITYGSYNNYRFAGYVVGGRRGKPARVLYRPSVHYFLIISVAAIIGLGITLGGAAIIIMEVVFGYHVLRG